MAWIVRLLSIGVEGDERSADIMRMAKPDDLGDLANPGLTLAEGKLLLAGMQQEIVAAQARGHAVRRPDCRACGDVCRVKDDPAYQPIRPLCVDGRSGEPRGACGRAA